MAADSTQGKQEGGDHYKRMKIQPIDFAEQNQMTGMETEALKHLCRHRFKDGLKDVKKLIHYAQMLALHYYGVKSDISYRSEIERPHKSPPAEDLKRFDEFLKDSIGLLTRVDRTGSDGNDVRVAIYGDEGLRCGVKGVLQHFPDGDGPGGIEWWIADAKTMSGDTKRSRMFWNTLHKLGLVGSVFNGKGKA